MPRLRAATPLSILKSSATAPSISDGWLAGTVHRAAWEFKPRRPLQDDIWELYDTTADFSLANDLAAKNPAKLKELQGLFLQEAVKYSVLPIDDRTLERMNAASAGRPDLMAGRTSLTVYQGMTGMSENVFISTKNRSHTITADVDIPQGGANGVILAQAGHFGGWSFYVKDGKPMYTYNWLGLQQYTVAAGQALPAGKGNRSAMSSPMTVAASAREAPARSTSTARVSPAAASSKPNAAHSRRMKALTWARMKVQPSPKAITSPSSSPERSKESRSI